MYFLQTYSKLSHLTNHESPGYILDRLPSQPIFCLVYNNNDQGKWENELREFWTKWNRLIPNFQKSIEKNLKISVDLEREFLMSLKGNRIIIGYDDLTRSGEINFDILFAIRINNSEKLRKVLLKMIKSMHEKAKIPWEPAKIPNTISYTMKLSKFYKNWKINPTVGIYRNYLILCSKKETLGKIVWGGGRFLLSFDEELANAFQMESPTVGYIDVKRTMNKLLPFFSKKNTIIKHILNLGIHKIYWTSSLKEKGLYRKFVIKSDGKFW